MPAGRAISLKVPSPRFHSSASYVFDVTYRSVRPSRSTSAATQPLPRSARLAPEPRLTSVNVPPSLWKRALRGRSPSSLQRATSRSA